MQTNCVEMLLDGVHLPPRLVAASLRCVIHTLLMLRLPHGEAVEGGRRRESERQPKGSKGAPLSLGGSISKGPSGLKPLQRAVAVAAGCTTPAEMAVAERSLPMGKDDHQQEGNIFSHSYGSQHADLPSLTRGCTAIQEARLRSRMTSTRPITDISGSHCSKCGQGGCLCAGSGTNSNSVSCRCSNGFVTGETPDLRLHAHASPPLSVMYLRVCEAPQLTEEVEQKLRTFIGIVESGATIQQRRNSRQQQQRRHQQQVYTMAIVLYVHRARAFGFLPSSIERVSFERWLLPISICWCTQSCMRCCRSSGSSRQSSRHRNNTSCCCDTTECCQMRSAGVRNTCSAAAEEHEGRGMSDLEHSKMQSAHQHQQQQQFAECLAWELQQQQDAEKAVRRVLFAIVEMATARQFHLPPPSASLQRYGYDVSISSNMGSLLGEWALQLPQAVRFF
ncbi:uncharacterized protein LOC34619935 [Cyclospora cayetanensis]|uniref:Uncharacterized protein LOC34619935 n=1 Tax=Cyclospora cayetanensis TaxID=88456 RepID=A0A6P6RSF5_9EIME|nr:uncharacterized protein LOC34619935 [Cyclospora cayetanensis]